MSEEYQERLERDIRTLQQAVAVFLERHGGAPNVPNGWMYASVIRGGSIDDIGGLSFSLLSTQDDPEGLLAALKRETPV